MTPVANPTQPPGEPAAAVTDPIEQAVLAILTGTPSPQAASQAGITPARLTAIARAYQHAGRAALAARTGPAGTWGQAALEFTDWDTAEHTAATALAPRLQDPEVTAGWWFLRKHPCWRIRYQPAPATTLSTASEQVGRILDDLTAAGLLRTWQPGIYEPETLAFGGPAGITIAHQLFCADTRGVLTTASQAPAASKASRPPGRMELSVLLCATLMRGAGLDWFEQGDTWHRITSLRPLPPGTATHPHHHAISVLLAADTRPASPLLASAGSAASAAPWISGFRHAGQALGATARDGQLQRGLRDILAHLIIFHWNRLGLTATTQATLARAGQDAIMNTASPPGTPGSD